MIKNACAVLLASRGIPMILEGDEFCTTQLGIITLIVKIMKYHS